jgi:hypothetical protein
MKYADDARPLKVGSYVKMNPFTIPDMVHLPHGCFPIKGEAEVAKVYTSMTGDRLANVKGSNNWHTVHLLIKGVDYE